MTLDENLVVEAILLNIPVDESVDVNVLHIVFYVKLYKNLQILIVPLGRLKFVGSQ